MAPPDPILGVDEAFHRCKDPKKVNLAPGIYLDDNGRAYILQCVREADKLLQKMELNKEYLPQAGLAEFVKLSGFAAFGDDNEHIKNGLMATVQTLSGTGALKLGFELIKRHYSGPKVIYVTTPTWGNHVQMPEFAYLDVKEHKYYNPENCSLDFKGMMNDISVLLFLFCNLEQVQLLLDALFY